MQWLTQLYSEDQIYFLETWIDNWFFIIAMLFLVVEILILAIKKRVNFQMLGDVITNFITLAGFLGIAAVFFAIYFGSLYWVYQNFSLTQIEITPWTIAIAILLADFIYYLEHRFMHRVGFAWATHTVHHSSPHFNLSVAYRFGPLDGILPLLFHLPMAVLGFNPFLILFAETMVQLYQTALHTEVFKKLPKWFEAIMNTPSHHRVHHGSNPQYIDKNYAGVFIIWDKLFGSFEPESETVIYGVAPPINSINPLKVFFHGYLNLFSKIFKANSLSEAFGYFFMPPNWKPPSNRNLKSNAEHDSI